jgi:hypothetical protein
LVKPDLKIMQKLFLVVLTVVFLASNLSAQVIKYKSTMQGKTDNSLNTEKSYNTVYITFDFDNKVIRKTQGGKTSNFKMRSSDTSDTMVGKTFTIHVSSTDEPRIIKVYFSTDITNAIWFDEENCTYTYGSLTKIQ